MPRPDFTPDEEFLISNVRSSIPGGMNNSFMWGYVLGGIVMAGFGALYQSVAMLVSAFALLCIFRVAEDRFQQNMTPRWRVILDKYEAALERPKPASDP